ncbi:hypothetical protein [Xanthomonas cucurbitae]|uniref:hypothetical protein n=1 Tax=Xanthomonas cucurbitae TaxID=56453 RepID=UPI003EBA9C02
MSHIAEHYRESTLAQILSTSSAARRCLSACASQDHRHAEQLRRRCNARSALNSRHARMRVASKREEAASRDLAQELRS